MSVREGPERVHRGFIEGQKESERVREGPERVHRGSKRVREGQ
jgi:hypothetical protein